MTGKVMSINISKTKGVPKEALTEALFIADFGIENDAHAGPWHRQVSLLASESIDKIRHLVKGLEYGRFAENITTQGLKLWEIPVGTRLRIGVTEHEITQIGKECHHGCAIKQLVGDCVMPREGIFTRVIKGGQVFVGDEICIIENTITE